MGSEDTLKIVLKGKMKYAQKGSSGTYFDHGQFKIKTFLFMPPPHVQNFHHTKSLYNSIT